VIRAITGFHLDEHGDWVAEMSCDHNRHVRHQPPFKEAPWVLSAEGRASRIGSPIECPLCDPA
jgi:tellurite methyltransferase